MENSALTKAVAAAGGQNSLAKLIGVRQSVLWYWLERSKKGVPAEYCEPIEAATGISRHDLRPDVFGASPTPAMSVAS